MKTVNNKIWMLSIVLMAAVSCNLDRYELGQIVYDENTPAIETSKDLDRFEVGLMSVFRSRFQGGYFYVDDLMCDGFNAAKSYGNNFGPLHRTDEDYNASNEDVEGVWANYYLAIKNYNIAISSVNIIADEELRTSAKANITKGEAFFCRAYSYLFLARHFGKVYKAATAETDLCVPLVTVWSNNTEVKRASNKAVYEQILSDIDSAAFFLANVKPVDEKGARHIDRPTIDAVQALYARYYLEVGEYAKAAEKAAALVDSKVYVLANNAKSFKEEFTEDAGKEPIMQMFASKDEVPNGLGYYTSLFKSDGEIYWTPYYLPSGKLVDAYEEKDLRLNNWFAKVGADSYPLQLGGITVNDENIRIFTKFLGNLAYESNDYPGAHNAVKPFRISEMYLIAAEGYCQAGDTPNARKYLNALQSARGATETTAELDNIKAEWFKETVGEGMRAQCLKRWGDGYTVRYAQPAAVTANMVEVGKKNLADRAFTAKDLYLLTFPIPNYELKITPTLEQNEGYALSVNN